MARIVHPCFHAALVGAARSESLLSPPASQFPVFPRHSSLVFLRASLCLAAPELHPGSGDAGPGRCVEHAEKRRLKSAGAVGLEPFLCEEQRDLPLPVLACGSCPLSVAGVTRCLLSPSTLIPCIQTSGVSPLRDRACIRLPSL